MEVGLASRALLMPQHRIPQLVLYGRVSLAQWCSLPGFPTPPPKPSPHVLLDKPGFKMLKNCFSVLCSSREPKAADLSFS